CSKAAVCIFAAIALFCGRAAATSLPIHYDLRLEPDIANKTLKGSLTLTVEGNAENLDLDCGDLSVDSVREGTQALKFVLADHHLRISLTPINRPAKLRLISIDYHGTPRRGIRFFPDRVQVYTVFSTSEW